MAALEYVDRPDYSAVIFRRTYPQLEMSMIERSREWLSPTDARYNETQHLWRFPSGARLKFAHLATEADKYDYQSAEFQFIGFDELTQFTQTQYEYLHSRLRRGAGSTIPLRMRSCSNPGGVGHDWVKWKFIEDENETQVVNPARLYIPALLRDNPYLDVEEYLKSLGELDDVTKAQLLKGDWKIAFKAGFLRSEKAKMVDIDDLPRSGWVRRLRYWDLAGTEPKVGYTDPDWTVGALVARNEDGNFYILHVVRWQKEPGPTEQRIKWFRHLDDEVFGQTEVHMEQEPGSAGKTVVAHYRRQMDDAPFYGDPVTGKKIERAKILAAKLDGDQICVVRGPWNRELFSEWDRFPTKGVHDDQVDSCSGAVSKLASPNALEYLQQALKDQRREEESDRIQLDKLRVLTAS